MVYRYNINDRPVRSSTVALFINLLFAALILSSCSSEPMRPVSQDKLPQFIDDISLSSLEDAAQKSISYLQELPENQQIYFHEKTFTVSWLITSLETFIAFIKQTESAKELQNKIKEHFDVFQARGAGRFWPRGKMLITGYYEPILDGSLTRTPPYLYPLYKLPPDLVILNSDDSNEKKTGRIENGELQPYWTREEIEKSNILAGHELVYLSDPVEAFILHVQGSGKIRLRDGSTKNIHYAWSNGHSYRSIGRLLVDEDIMDLEDVTLPAIRKYLADHPDERDRILYHNESFIFFQWEDTDGPVGSLGKVLTAGRSVAVDQEVFPAGALGFLQTEKPVLDSNGAISEWTAMSRFVLVQDSGSAIKGTGRLDLFWGNDHYAETAAGSMKHDGKLYFLVLKQKSG